jgi:hypothetical protein
MPNEAWLVHRKPIFAAAAGTVVRCWRGAPENPDPPNLHGDFERIIAGGTFLFVEDAAGDVILYAHMIPGTIPEELCPHDLPFAIAPTDIVTGQFAEDRHGDVPAADQASVQRGEFLGCAGNSGASSNPHFHVHKAAGLTPGNNVYGPALSLPFEFFLWKDDTGGASWSAGTNVPLPPGPIVFLPPAQDPAGGVRNLITASLDDFENQRETWAGDGFRIHDFESYLDDGGARLYAGIFRPIDERQEFRVDLAWPDFLNEWQTLEGQGFRLEDFETYLLGSGRVYAGVFNPGSFAPKALVGYGWDDFVDSWSAIEAEGYRLHDHEVYTLDGRRVYTGIFTPDTYPPFAHFGRPFDEFLEAWTEAEQRGYFLHDLEVYRSGKDLRFNGVFKPGAPNLNRGAWIDKSAESFFPAWTDFENANYRIHDFEGHENDMEDVDLRRYSGIFLRTRTPTPCD